MGKVFEAEGCLNLSSYARLFIGTAHFKKAHLNKEHFKKRICFLRLRLLCFQEV
jgi:hypothetical protein